VDSEIVYKFFADYIYKNTGIVYVKADYYRLDMRLNAMVRELKVDSPKEVYELYKKNITKEMHTLIVDLATNNETYFMRDKKPFKALTKAVLPRVLEKKSIKGSNIWCAGCSTGQEVYSILMSIDKDCGKEVFNNVKIDASDISTNALSKAKNGNYNGLEVQRGLPATNLVQYFSQVDDGTWNISNDLKGKINFFQHNLLVDPFPKNKYEILFCRNVLIYQDIENKKTILENFFHALVPGGFLILGSGESLIGTNLAFKQEQIEETIIYEKIDEKALKSLPVTKIESAC